MVSERQIVDRSIAILFPTNRLVEGFAKALMSEGIPVETRKSGLDFRSTLPKLLTIHSAKGLTFDTVLLPRLVDGKFPKEFEPWVERLLYVAITRATKWVYFSTVNRQSIPALRRVYSLTELNPAPVTLETTKDLKRRKKPAPVSGQANKELLDIL